MNVQLKGLPSWRQGQWDIQCWCLRNRLLHVNWWARHTLSWCLHVSHTPALQRDPPSSVSSAGPTRSVDPMWKYRYMKISYTKILLAKYRHLQEVCAHSHFSTSDVSTKFLAYSTKRQIPHLPVTIEIVHKFLLSGSLFLCNSLWSTVPDKASLWNQPTISCHGIHNHTFVKA